MRNKWLNTLVKVLLAAGLFAGLFVSYLLLTEMGAEVDSLSMERCGSHILTVFAACPGLPSVAGPSVCCLAL